MQIMKVGGVPAKKFLTDLKKEISEDNVSNGAAALAYYLMLSIFPAMIALLTLLPYLPIDNLQGAILDFMKQAMPGEAAQMFTGVVQQVTSERKGGLLSFGLLAALWAASSGMFAVMQQLNITYDVKEGRGFLKSRGISLLLTVIFGALIVGAFALVVFGGQIQGWMENSLGFGGVVRALFAVLRWGIIAGAMLLAFACTYYFGPDVKQEFKWVSPGSIAGVVLLAAASLGFGFYVSNFGKYSATYGSIGAVIVLMLWLYITGLVVLLGSEVNALVEHYSAHGKSKGEKQPHANAA